MSTRSTWNRNTSRRARRGVVAISEAEGTTHLELTAVLLPEGPVTADAISALVWQAEKHLASGRLPGRCAIEGSWSAAQTRALSPADLLPLLESRVPELRELGVRLAAQVAGALSP